RRLGKRQQEFVSVKMLYELALIEKCTFKLVVQEIFVEMGRRYSIRLRANVAIRGLNLRFRRERDCMVVRPWSIAWSRLRQRYLSQTMAVKNMRKSVSSAVQVRS